MDFYNSSTSTNSTGSPTTGESLTDKMRIQSIYLICKLIFSHIIKIHSFSIYNN